MERKTIGAYAGSVAGAQLLLYGAMMFCGDDAASRCFYLDPRIGLRVLESMVVTSPQTRLSWFGLLSMLALAALAIAARRNITGLSAYLIGEFVMGAPSVLFFAVVVWAGVGPTHGFSVPELVIPVFIFIVASFVPFWLGVGAWRRARSRREGVGASSA